MKRSVKILIAILLLLMTGHAAANTNPVAVDDEYPGLSNTLEHLLPVLENDRDDDGDPLFIASLVETPEHPLNDHAAVLEVVASGTQIRYRAQPSFVGEDTFVYCVSDGTGFHTAVVTVSVSTSEGPRLEVRLESTGAAIVPGSTVQLSTTYAEVPLHDRFLIANTGTTDTRLEILGFTDLNNIANPLHFGVPAPLSIPGQSSAAVDVTVHASETASSPQRVYRLETNDPTNGHVEFTVGATVIDPEIEVATDTGVIVDGSQDPDPFEGGRGDEVDRTYTIRSTGTSTLRLTDFASLLGTCPDFWLMTALPTELELAPGEETSFVLRLNTSAEAQRSCTVSLPNNDFDEGGFSFTVHGNVVDLRDCSSGPEGPEFDDGALGTAYIELLRAVKDEPRYCEWRTEWRSLSGWGNGGSQNHAPLSAAIGVIRDPAFVDPEKYPSNLIDWWQKYFDAQLGVEDDGQVHDSKKQLGSSELASSIYQGGVMAAAVVVNFQATRYVLDYQAANQGNPGAAPPPWLGVRDRARAYLKANLAFLAAAATPKPNEIRFRNGAGTKQPAGSQPGLRYLPMAGMRSPAGRFGTSERTGLFNRVLYRKITGQESADLRAFLAEAERIWDADLGLPLSLLYGLTGSERSALAGIESTGIPANFLQDFNLSSVKTLVAYDILGWTGGARMTLMKTNKNGNTTPTYGMVYDPGTRLVHALYPFSDRVVPGDPPSGCSTAPSRLHRKSVSSGEAGFLISGSVHTIWAENQPSPSQAVCHPARRDEIELPGAADYCIRFRPDRSPRVETGSCHPEIFARRLAEWDFESTPLGIDATAHRREGTTIGADPVGVAGPAGQGTAVRLDGAAMFRIPEPLGILASSDELTVMAWVKVPMHSQSNVFRLRQPLALASDRFSVANYATGDGWKTVVADPAPPVGAWYHLAGVFQQGDLTIYVDGVLAGSGKAPFVETEGGDPGAWSIGARELSETSADQFFVGELDDVKVFSVALEPDEILKEAGLKD
ncbi:MAG: LamG-like jellyroll fold domain-containing protein [Acidobacteriota bacterium]